MADTKITGYAAFSQIAPATDVLVGVDISDTSMDATGTNLKLTSDFLKYAGMSGIQGLELAYNSATVLRVKTGVAGVNGKQVSFTQTDYTSGSSMKDIANSTVTLAASKAYFVFLSDAGVIGIEIFDTTGDGATPTFDTTFDYWKAASTGVAWRRIGKFWTDGSGNIRPFIMKSGGRVRTYELLNHSGLLLVNGTSQASHTAIPSTGTYLSADDTRHKWVFTFTTASGEFTGGVYLSIDGGTDDFAQVYFAFGTAITAGAQPQVMHEWIPNNSSWHYKTAGSALAYVGPAGIELFV